MKPTLIGIVGATGSGKSTISKHLVEHHGYTRMSMAGPLKDMLLALGLSDLDVNGPQEHRLKPCLLLGGKSPRDAMMTLGTEWGREMIHGDIWVNAIQDRIVKFRAFRKRGFRGVVIDDIRFPNEWAMIQRLGGVLWRVRREEVEKPRSWLDIQHYAGRHCFITKTARLFGWKPGHESEHYWPDAPVNVRLWNNGTEETLRSAVSGLIALDAATGT